MRYTPISPAEKEEVDFWRLYLTTGGMHRHRTEFRRRKMEHAPLVDPVLIQAVSRIDASDVSILDVGAGPLTTVGTYHPARQLHVMAIDGLAEEYHRLLQELKITPPVITQQCHGEDICETFPGMFVDIVYCRNALDHMEDPVKVLDNMLGVLRPGGRIILRHKENEATRMKYAGLHQWDLRLSDGQMLICNRKQETAIKEIDGFDRCHVNCFKDASDGVWRLVCTIDKDL